MNLLSLLGGLFGPPVARAVAKPVQKLATWTATHVAGEERGTVIAAAFAPALDGEADALTAAAVAHLTATK